MEVKTVALSLFLSAGAPAIDAEAESYTSPTAEQWERLFAALRRLTPQQTREALAYAEELLAEQEGQS